MLQLSTVMVGNRVMKITGDLAINGCLDHNLVVSYVGNGFSMSDASLHYNFNLTGQNKKINFVFLSDHKNFKDIRFGVSFEVLEGESGVRNYTHFSFKISRYDQKGIYYSRSTLSWLQWRLHSRGSKMYQRNWLIPRSPDSPISQETLSYLQRSRHPDLAHLRVLSIGNAWQTRFPILRHF